MCVDLFKKWTSEAGSLLLIEPLNHFKGLRIRKLIPLFAFSSFHQRKARRWVEERNLKLSQRKSNGSWVWIGGVRCLLSWGVLTRPPHFPNQNFLQLLISFLFFSLLTDAFFFFLFSHLLVVQWISFALPSLHGQLGHFQ